MQTGSSELFWLARETDTRLDSLAALVREGKSLDEALNFTRYLISSRLVNILDAHTCKADISKGQMPMDGKSIRRKAEELQRKVQRRFETRDTKPQVEQSELVEIRRTLAMLSAQVARQVAMEQGADDASVSPAPPLKIIQGGLGA